MRILHLGLGSFHRAHQAAYVQRLVDAGDGTWTLAAGNIRGDDANVISALVAQRGRFTLETVAPDGVRRYAQISSIGTVVPFEHGLDELTMIAADPATRIISFTVTEAGYGPGQPIFPALAALLRTRRARGSGAVTLLCCDNLRHNGERSRSGLLAFLESIEEPGLLAWVRDNTTSPNCMVDRITPRPTAELRERVRAATGWDDGAPVMAEEYLQWVIEESFIAGRPPWEKVGVEMVASVVPYEEAKIRLLNATHSAIAWAGSLLHYRYVHEGAADPRIVALAREYADDAIACLTPSRVDLPRYRDTVLDRFRNAALGDTNQRVVADSHAKLQGFVAPTLRERLARGQPIEGVALLPALYLAYLRHVLRGDCPWVHQDSTLSAKDAQALVESPDPVARLASDATLWSACAADPGLLSALRKATRRINALSRGLEA